MPGLYIPRLKEQNAIITGCVRTNGGSCEKTGDPSTRYLGTEYGQEMRLAPGGIYFTAGRNDLILTFDDEEGVKISSHKEIVIEAKEEIIFDSKQKVAFNAPSQIRMVTPYGGFSMENEMNFANMKTIIECTDETELPLVEQKLMLQQPNILNKPQATEDSGIDWGGIMNAVLGVRVAEASPLEQGDVISSAPDDGPTLRADDGTGSPIVSHDTMIQDDGKGVVTDTNIYRTEDGRTIIEKSDGTTTYGDNKGHGATTYNADGYKIREADYGRVTEYDGTPAENVTYKNLDACFTDEGNKSYLYKSPATDGSPEVYVGKVEASGSNYASSITDFEFGKSLSVTGVNVTGTVPIMSGASEKSELNILKGQLSGLLKLNLHPKKMDDILALFKITLMADVVDGSLGITGTPDSTSLMGYDISYTVSRCLGAAGEDFKIQLNADGSVEGHVGVAALGGAKCSFKIKKQ